MDNVQNQGNQVPATPNTEELKEEQEILTVPTLEEAKARVVEELGLDADYDVGLVEKLAKKELAEREKLSKAIGQKIKYRDTLNTLSKTSDAREPVRSGSQDLDAIVESKFNEWELAKMDLSENLKSEVKSYAKAKGIPYRDVLKSDYFDFVKGKENERLRSEEASVSSKGISMKARRDFGNLNDEDIKNLSSEDLTEYKKWLKS